MIYDVLDNFKNYTTLHPLFQEIQEFVSTTNLFAIPAGRHAIGNHGCFALVESYVTKDSSDCFIECHRKYIDIQMVLKGTERIGVCAAQSCKQLSYDEEKDFQELEGRVDFLTMKAGDFAVLYPCDGHMTKVKYEEEPEEVKKIVVKVPVEWH